MKDNYRHKKSLGQNFLHDQRILEKIITAASLTKDDVVVEIGPGQGVLTRLIAPHVKKLICVEADRDLIEPLRVEFAGSNVEIIHADFLSLSFPNVLIGNPEKIKIIGNIPYYISTPILEKLIENSAHISQAFLTVQLEFGQRLAAKPGAEGCGALSYFASYHADVKMLFRIKNACFKPAPKVDSCFVSLMMRDFPNPPKDQALMFQLIRQSFTQRRKTIGNALSAIVEKDKLNSVLAQLKISPQSRPEVLNLNNYVDISNALVI